MPISINGTGTITGLTAGGLPASSITTTSIADSAVTPVKTTGGPAFSAYQSSAQTLTASTANKVQLQSEEFDTANCFDSTTNYRFTPNVAGYYQVSFAVRSDAASLTALHTYVYKNGVIFKGAQFTNSGLSAFMSSSSALIYLNGSTDYIELWCYSGLAVTLAASLSNTYFQAILIRPT